MHGQFILSDWLGIQKHITAIITTFSHPHHKLVASLAFVMQIKHS